MAKGAFGGGATVVAALGLVALGLLAPAAGAGPAAAQDSSRRSLPLRIDCPDAPLYIAGGLSLLRDANAPGLVLVARLQESRGRADYAITCSTAAVPAARATGTADTYDFVCTALDAGRTSGGAQARMRGTVPAGLGIDNPETQAAIAAAACPAARLALARHRAARD